MNEWLLKAAGGTWLDPPSKEAILKAKQLYRDKIIELIQDVNGDAATIVVPESGEDEEARAIAETEKLARIRNEQGLND